MNPLVQIPYNAVLFAPEVGLYGSNSVVISGSFSVSLSGGGSVSQAGLVPADARFLLFKGRWSDVVPVLVSLNGQEVAYTTFSTSPNYTAYVADVLAFAGQSATLRFSALSSGFYVIDDVEFAVPEPSALALLGLGGVCLLSRILKRRRGC
jgi:hypothetical protein